MELAEGETARQAAAQWPDRGLRGSADRPPDRPGGLEAAHERGVIHSDLKPANVIVDSEGRVKILDVELPKALASEPVESETELLSMSPTFTAERTRAGVVLGTASYMSPEQARGRRMDKRTDVWRAAAVGTDCMTADSTAGAQSPVVRAGAAPKC